MLPPGARIGVLCDPTSAVNALWMHDTEEAAQALRVSLVPTGVRSVEDFEHAFAVMQQENARGCIVLGGACIGSDTCRWARASLHVAHATRPRGWGLDVVCGCRA